MSNTILTLSEEPAARWVEALDPVVLRSSITGVRITSSVTYWLDFSTLDFDEALSFIDRIVVANDAVPIVCMVPFPKDEDAFALLARGARGYCHVAAAPAQLRLVANTVKNGGFGCRRRYCAESWRVLAAWFHRFRRESQCLWMI